MDRLPVVGERVVAPSGLGVVTRLVAADGRYPFAFVCPDAGGPRIHYVRDLEPEGSVVPAAPAGAVR